MTSVLHLLTSPAAGAVRMLPVLADAAIKGLVVFGAAAIAVALCRRRSAATRHAIWAGAVGAQLALPILSALLPAWRVPLVDRLDRRFAATRIMTPEPMNIVISGANADAAPVEVNVPEPAVIIDGTPAPDLEPVIAARAQARAEAAMARAAARMARAEARIARAEARAEARAARHAAMAEGIAIAGSFGSGSGFGGTVLVRQASPSAFSRLTEFASGMGARSWLRAAGIIWLLGALAILARFVAGTLAVSRLARRSERVDDGRWLSLTQRIAMRLGVARPMTLLRSGRFEVPVTWGIVYPVVLLPDDADQWTDERRRYVLVHEMAHVKRVDAFTQLVAQLTLAAFWFNPFVWLAAHRMRVEREHACDDYVLREGTPASTYAADLLAMVRSLGTTGRAQPAFAALAMARPDELETRMHAILDPGQDRGSLSSRSTVGLALCSLLLLLPLAAFRPFSAHQADPFVGSDEAPDVAAMLSDVSGVPEIPAVPEIPEMPAMPAMPEIPAMPAMPAHLEENLQSAAAALATTRASLAEVAARSSALTAAIAPAAPARVAAWSSRGESCSSISLHRTGTSTSIHSSSDEDDTSFQYISSSAGRCLQVAVWGKVEFTDDERDVRRVSADGRFYVRERRPNADRELTVTPGDGDGPRYAFSVDGERASFDDEGHAWLGELLPEVLRESGLNAKQRVARIRRDGGVSAVLADIGRTQSTSAKRAAYEALLQEGTLSSDDEARVARQAGVDLASSDGELGAVLAAMGKRGHFAAPMAEAFGAAVEHMSSDGEKRELLQQYALKGDRDMLLVSMKQAGSISSDGEKSEFLRATASRYLANDDEQLRNAFFSVTQTISSDGEKHEVLNAALPYAQKPAILFAVLDAARTISSDGEKSELLVTILRKRVPMTPQLREAFMKTTRTLSSDGEYRRVMEAMLES